MKQKIREKLGCEKKMLYLSVAAGFGCALLEVVMSMVTRSQALLMDSVFDMAEVLVAGMFVILLPLIYRPETEKMPYGFAQLESIFMIIKGLALTVITVNLLVDNLKTILSGGNQVESMAVGIFELSMGMFSVLILAVLGKKNKGMNSQVLAGEILSWKIDVFCCLGVGVAFLSQLVLKNSALAGISLYVDQVVAIGIAIIMLPQPIKILLSSLRSLVLLAPKSEDLEYIKETAKEAFEGTGIRITCCDCVQTGRKIWVDIYMKSAKGILELEKMKEMRRRILKKLQVQFEDIHVELTPDLDGTNV